LPYSGTTFPAARNRFSVFTARIAADTGAAE